MDLATAERAKYERMWCDPVYRHSAPGEHLVEQAIGEMGMVRGDSVIDFGCGTGRPALAFHDAGYRVLAVDFAANCLDSEPARKLTFRQACLWELPEDIHADHGFCTDVMEHIPPERVDRTLACISGAVLNGVYFQIATRADVMGKRIGETLHLTVCTAGWWEATLAEYWDAVSVAHKHGSLTAVCR